jgi:hypothetical protein
VTEDQLRQLLQSARDLEFFRLVVSTVLVTVGLVFEGPEIFHDTRDAIQGLDNPKKRWIKLLSAVGWLLIVAGVTLEGVFEVRVSNADGKLQEFERSTVESLDKLVIAAQNSATLARGEADRAKNDAGAAKTDAGVAKQKSRDANTLASKADTRASAALGKANDALAFLTPRTLTPKETAELRDALRPLALANPDVPIIVIALEESGLGIEVADAMNRAGFRKVQVQTEFKLPFGMRMDAPFKYFEIGDHIARVLIQRGIGPWVASPPDPNGDVVRIVIGDIRTASLPPLHPKAPTK